MKQLFFLISLLLLASTSSAQQAVKGLVVDGEGESLIGVNILELGTANGTITDIDGTYSLTVQEGASLVFSFTGMETMTEVVGSRSTIDVTLESSSELLDEVVVTALGFTQRKDETGSTVVSVAPENIKRSGEANLLNSLGAKASNVQINRANGDPGAGSSIKIRGANTITGSSSPLIILDGIPISNATNYSGIGRGGGSFGGTSQQSRLNDINANDIESVQILKGASAAALWGSRAANGVLVITTKSGKSGKPKISWKSTLSIDEVNQRYELQNVWGQGRSGSYSPTRAESWGDYIPDRSGSADVVDQSGQYFEAEDGTLYYPIDEKNSTETFLESNWDAVFQKGGYFQNDLSISGGNDKSNFFFSLGRIDQEGIIKNSDYDRTNLRLNNKYFFTDWLNISSKASFTHTKSNRIQQNSNTAGLLLGLLRTPVDFDNRDYKGSYFSSSGLETVNRQRSYRRYLGNNVNPTYNNPLWTSFEQESSTAVDRFIFAPEINILPTDFLQVTLRGGVDTYVDRRLYFFPIGSAGGGSSGSFSEDVIRNQEVNFDAITRANFSLTDDIGLVATVGWNFNDRRYQRNSAGIERFQVNISKQTFDLNEAQDASLAQRVKTNRRTNRAYGSLSFDVFDQVFVNMGGAAEAASTANKTFFYPSTDVAWQFTETLNMNKDGALSFGKMRASWGKVGIAPPAHASQTLAEGGFEYSTYSDPLNIGLFGGGFRLDNNQGNPFLVPEIKTEWEIGFDLRFFHDKLSWNMTYYQNEIKDVIIPLELAPSFGYSSIRSNAADMQNKGFEIDLDYSILKKQDWDLAIYGNWATNKNLVTELRGAETIDLSGGSVSSRAIKGYPLGALYGTGSQTNADGSFIIDEDRPGFPKLTASPIILGDPNPDWRGGLGIRVGYKGFQINALVEHSQGGEFSPRTLHVLNRFGTTLETANRITLTEDLKNYAGNTIAAGTTVRGNIQNFGAGDVLLDESWYRTGIGGGFGDAQAYNFNTKSATFTRFREMTLTYSLAGDWLEQKTKIGSVDFAFSGRNLILWDDIPGIDPEINQTGVGNGAGLDYFTNPSTRSFVFSMTVNY
ncbi:MAG: TonB-linked SusC/RagA family outer membrane protein [Saprospiraceae bacterium]|jgi:TonB-linked SusC/RagA family outer membrane protein